MNIFYELKDKICNCSSISDFRECIKLIVNAKLEDYLENILIQQTNYEFRKKIIEKLVDKYINENYKMLDESKVIFTCTTGNSRTGGSQFVKLSCCCKHIEECIGGRPDICYLEYEKLAGKNAIPNPTSSFNIAYYTK